MAGSFQRPTRLSAWQRLKRWLDYWRLGAQIIFRRDTWTDRSRPLGSEPEGPQFAAAFLLLFLVFGLLCALLYAVIFAILLIGPLIAGFFFNLSRMEPASYPIAESIFALLFVLFGLLMLLLTHRMQLGRTLNPPRQGLGLFISKGSVQFWQGTALCAIVAVQIALPAYAQTISILFWVVVGCLVLWPLVGTLFTLLLRGVRRLARRRGMNE